MTFNSETTSVIGNEYHAGSNKTVFTAVYDCCVCSSPISNPLVFKINDQYFHDSCLNCSECHVPLHEQCYARNGSIYCREHCFTKFGNTCAACGYGISPVEVVRRANEFVYHLACFACLICRRQLKTGNEFYLIADQQLVCRADYEILKNKEFDDNSKRSRTTISQKQLDVLKQVYLSTPKPPRHLRESLAAETGLDMRVVQVWFQNRRAKEKRVNREAGKRWTMFTHKGATKKLKTTGRSKRREENSSSDECSIRGPAAQSARPNTHRSNYGELTGLLVASSYPPISELIPKHSFSPSSSTITINDDCDSSSEVNFNMITATDNIQSRHPSLARLRSSHAQ